MSFKSFGVYESREAGEALPGLTARAPGGVGRVVIYTTAPSDYDWSFTRELSADVGKVSNGKTIRKVEIVEARAETQCARYASGLHLAVDFAEFSKLLAYNLVTPRDAGDAGDAGDAQADE